MEKQTRGFKIISGGQTGVDRAALDASLALGIPCGGWCPKGRKAEDGSIPERYPLQETDSSSYRGRTERPAFRWHTDLDLGEAHRRNSFNSPSGQEA